jgi:hypothetical protein
MQDRQPRLTFRVDLPGGQDRLRQMILYVAKANVHTERFGLIKLNKIIWKADFSSFAARGVPVTGRAYKRQKFGPVATDMMPLHSDMLRDGLIALQRVDFGEEVVERRTIPLVEPKLGAFSSADIEFVDASIEHYRNMTGMESSDDSHGVAWRTRSNGEDMPYESSILSDRRPGAAQMRRMLQRIYDRGLQSE